MYALNPGISFCIIDDTVVLLDSYQDRYFALEAAAGRRFIAWLEDPELTPEFPLVERAMQGIIRACAEPVLGLKPCVAPELRREWTVEHRNSPSFGSAIIAFATILTATIKLRVRPFARIVRDVPDDHALGRPEPIDLPRDRIDAFLNLARFSPWKLECLPFATALRSYLLAHDIRSDLILGVKLKPFAAHCWIQIGDLVIGDTVEAVSIFTPIRVVR